MKLITSMLILLALLELIVWTSSNHVNLKTSSATINTIKSLIKSTNQNSIQIKNQNNSAFSSKIKSTIKSSQNYSENIIHKESKQNIIILYLI